MKGHLPYLVSVVVIVLAFGCKFKEDPWANSPPPLYKPAPAYLFNPPGGYDFNPIEKKPVVPLRGSNGDVISTGTPVSLNYDTYPVSEISVDTIQVRPLGDWEQVENYTNKIPVSWKSHGIKIKLDSLFSHTSIISHKSSFKVEPEIFPVTIQEPVRLAVSDYPVNHQTGFKNIGTPTGYENSTNTSVVLDSLFNIWTVSGGYLLNKISGSYLVNYIPSKAINTNFHRAIRSNAGNIWIASNGWVSLFNGKSFLVYRLPQLNERVNDIFEDENGELWLGTNGNGLWKFNGESFRFYTSEEGLSGDIVYSISKDNKNRTWIGTNKGITVINGDNEYVKINQRNGLDVRNVRSVFAQNDSSIWFLSQEGGFHHYDGNIIKNLEYDPSFLHRKEPLLFDNDQLYSMGDSPSIMEDKSGEIWFSDQHGLNRLSEDGSYITLFQGQDEAGNIHDLTSDGHGNLYSAKFYGGISILPGNKEEQYSFNKPRTRFWERGHFEDSEGRIWFSNIDPTVYLFDDKRLMSNESLVKPFGYRPYAFGEDEKGNIWIGGNIGHLSKYSGEIIHNYQLPSKGTIRKIQQLENGNILIANQNGLLLFNGTEIKHYSRGLNNGLLFASNFSYQRINGRIWIDTNTFGEGDYTCLLEDEKFTFYSEKEGFFKGGSFANLLDQKGNHWFAGNNGIQVLSGDSIFFIGKEQGLADDRYYALAEDHNGNIWTASRFGLACIVLNSSTPEFAIENIITMTRWNGVQGIDNISNSFLIDRSNRLWVGNANGTHILDVNNFNSSPAEVKPQFISLNLNSGYSDFSNPSDSISARVNYSGLIPFSNMPVGLELNHTLDHVTFMFDANDWSAQDQVKFTYRLIGQDAAWSDPTTETSVDYRNLSPGDYTFMLSAIGQNREWSKPIQYTFTILPPPWLTWWAYGVYTLILLGIFFIYRNYLIKKEARKADLRIKLIEADKIRELDEHKTRFFTNITHEFRTPLSLIKGTINSLKRPGVSLEERDSNLRLLQRNSDRLTRLVNNLLELTKLQESRMDLRLVKCDLVSEIRYHMSAFQSVAQSRNISFSINTPESIMAYCDTEKLEIILYNLLSNAFKHVDKMGEIKLEIDTGHVSDLDFSVGIGNYKGQYISLSVSDNGPGIPADKLEKIFDRFEKGLHEDRYTEGMGIGLALTRELVEFQNGTIDLHSIQGEGTTVSVFLPVERQGFGKVHSVSEVWISRLAEESLSQKTEPGIKEGEKNSLSTGQKVLLIAEDNEDLRMYLRQEFAGEFNLLIAENGKIAWDKCLEYLPDLVITDLMMPEMDGLELCKHIKEHMLTCHIPVIMLTAKSGADNRIEGHKSGADDYMQKPFNTEELRVKAHNLIQQREKLRKKFSNNFIAVGDKDQNENINAEFLMNLVQVVDENIDNQQLSTDFIVSRMNMSRSQLYRKLKAITGNTINRFINDYRLEKAEAMLRSNGKNVSQVAYDCGFQSPSYFTTVFKKKYGVNPLEYLKKYNS